MLNREPLDEKVQRLKRFLRLFDLGQDFIYGIFNQSEKLLGGQDCILARRELSWKSLLDPQGLYQPGLVTECQRRWSRLRLRSFMSIALRFTVIPQMASAAVP
jgi:hypothetical protein